jgi:serine/threonine-protein kinase
MASSDTNSSGSVGLNPSLDSEIGKFVVDTGLVTQDEVNFCREQQKQSSDPNQRSLADLLVEHNFMTVNQAKRIKRSLEDRKNNQIPGFHLIKLLGKGAMAKVYMAKQISLDRTVAIKVLPKTRSNDADFVDRFYKEGKAAARLAHPNIVQAIDVGANPEGIHYFVMEYVEGPTLYDMMQPPPTGQGKHFSEDEALDISIQMCEALVHAHQRGLVHRDVKPKNILLTPQGIAKLTDLGLAREVNDKQAAESEAGKAYGTPYYISPEQIRGEIDIDFRADIYSLGATLYHLVTGRPPFDGETPSAVMHRHLKDEMIPPDHLNPELSAGISEIIELAMAKDKNDRYVSTTDMLEDLRAVRTGAPPVHARHQVNMDTVGKLEETARTIDIEPKPRPSVWESPAVISVLTVAGVSLVLNLIFGLVWIASK